MRQKLLQYLLKSRGKGINTARGIQIIFEALFGANNNQKCKVLALQFAKNLIQEYVYVEWTFSINFIQRNLNWTISYF